MLLGKSIMSWNVPAISDGDPEKFVELLTLAGFEGVMLKSADGNSVQTVSRYSPWPTWGENIRQELIVALRAAGIHVYFWHFLYGYDPEGELAVAQEQIDRFQPDAYIWDVESSFDRKPNAEDNARMISSCLSISHPYLTQGLCWWALHRSSTGVEWHPTRVAKAFFETVKVGLPMMYWQGVGFTAAVNYFYRSIVQWREITNLPIIPIGRSYNGDGGYADAAGITAFANEVYIKAAEFNLIGNSWYSLDKAVQNLSWMNALQDSPKWGNAITLTLEEKVERLVHAHPNLFPELVGR
jgi:hypothetical protein